MKRPMFVSAYLKPRQIPPKSLLYEESVCLNLPGQPVSDRSEHFQVVDLLLVYVFVGYVTITLLSQYVRLNVYHQTMKTY